MRLPSIRVTRRHAEWMIGSGQRSSALYRAVIPPLVVYVESLQARRPELTVTVIDPDLAVRHWWQRPLNEDTAARLRHALAPLQKVVVTSVRFHVQRSEWPLARSV